MLLYYLQSCQHLQQTIGGDVTDRFRKATQDIQTKVLGIKSDNPLYYDGNKLYISDPARANFVSYVFSSTRIYQYQTGNYVVTQSLYSNQYRSSIDSLCRKLGL